MFFSQISTIVLTLSALGTSLPTPDLASSSISLPHTLRSSIAQPVPLYPRNETAEIGVARAGGVLNTDAAAEANIRDDTATRAFSSAAIKSSDGQCLFVDPTAGDFRQNLIPVTLKACDGSTEQQFDFITKGKHNQEEGSVLVVSAATQGCLNFDPRRAAGDQVIIFSCGGRADGEGLQTDSQLFTFKAGVTSLPLSLTNNGDSTCMIPAGGKLGSATCNGDASQNFTIG